MTAEVIDFKEKANSEIEPKCSFCKRTKKEVKNLVASADGRFHICDRCTKHSVALLNKHSGDQNG